MTAVPQLRFLLLGILSIAWVALGGEALCRFEGNWRLDHLTLTKGPLIPPDRAQAMNAERALVEEITYQKGVDPEWFFLPPASLSMPQNPELEARTRANPSESMQENFVWNEAWLAHPTPSFVEMIRQQKTNSLFAFPSYDGSPMPPYRLYPSNNFFPAPWVTNRWGWFGADTGVRKPPHVIRIGIVGDSTSHNMYALNLQSYLDAWSKHRGSDVRFQVFSAARQGLGIDDELAVLKFEFGPLGLDYVYEYFAPNFSLNPPTMLSLANLPDRGRSGIKPVSHQASDASDRRFRSPIYRFSALARRTSEFFGAAGPEEVLHEPAKPVITLNLPSGLGGPGKLAKAEQSSYFKWLASRLDAFKATAESIKAAPFVSTERLCVWDRMVLRKEKNERLYDVLNGPLFWPFTYADLRLMTNAHNDLIKAWGEANAVTVVDIDGRMPPSPDLCDDPWHDTYIGPQMRAWLIFEAMLPQLEHDLRTGAVPRANGIDSSVHPYLSKPIERIDRKQWLTKVEAKAALAGSAN